MVVLDPIQGFLGADVDMHRANEIRPLMKRIAVLSEKYHCAVILIGHMNKNSNGKSSYRGLGSIDFQAAGLNGLENMISVPMNFLMETEEDRKVGKQKNFSLRYWQMEE